MKLLKSLSLSAAALAISFAGPALAHHHEATETATEAATSSPALWKVADEDTTIYLFGTVHALPSDVDWKTGMIGEALDSSDTLVTEVDMTPESMAQLPGLIMGKGILPTGTTLRSLMSEEQKTTYEAGLAKLGVPAEALDTLEPWLAAMQLAQVVMQKAGFNAESGVETVLEKTVKEGMGRDALETMEFQISVFDEMPQDAQLDFLLQSVEKPEEGIAMLKDLVDDWKVGKVDEIAAMLNEGMMANPVLAERLLYSRNTYWAGWIDARLDQPGTVFMAVGAGHLAGTKSVQDLLAQKGISTTRVQ